MPLPSEPVQLVKEHPESGAFGDLLDPETGGDEGEKKYLVSHAIKMGLLNRSKESIIKYTNEQELDAPAPGPPSAPPLSGKTNKLGSFRGFGALQQKPTEGVYALKLALSSRAQTKKTTSAPEVEVRCALEMHPDEEHILQELSHDSSLKGDLRAVTILQVGRRLV
jgi:hypothetical protein